MKLSIEILTMILHKSDVSTLFNAYSSCRLLHDLLANDNVGIWRDARKREGFPDPLSIGMSDAKFLRIVNTRGCSMCHNHPLTRKVQWELGGLRLCKSCFRAHTVSTYGKDIPFIDTGRFQQSLWLDVRSNIPFDNTYVKALQIFGQDMRKYEESKKIDRLTLYEKRRKELIEHICRNLPDVCWQACPPFQYACRSSRPLSVKDADRVLTKVVVWMTRS